MTDLNAQVAEEVMGWELQNCGEAYPFDAVMWCKGKAIMRSDNDWDPEHSIADAWLVVEEMRGRGWHVDIDDWGMRKRNHIWRVLFTKDRDDMRRDDGLAFGEEGQLPGAICRAALAAVRQDRT